jgi:hypothetical protein
MTAAVPRLDRPRPQPLPAPRLRLAAVALAALLAACGGGSGSSGTSSPQACADCGTAIVSLTDADGDFASYTVDVVSLSLERANGSVVQTLPRTARVDFAQLVDLSELLTALDVPAGRYVKGSITVDYTNASVYVEQNGAPVPATVIGTDGQPLGQVTLALDLATDRPLTITRGRIARLALDFDLLASNTVDLATTPVTVTAKPFVVASVDVADSKDLRVRGLLESVDVGAQSYVVDLRPFRDGAGGHGEVTVRTTTDTGYEIDGAVYSGNAGLTALAALPAGTLTAAFGSYAPAERRFTAARVYAGTSLVLPDTDALAGTVIARSGDVLTVRGATVERDDGSAAFEWRDVQVTVADATVVRRDGDGRDLLDDSALSIGSRIRVVGQFGSDADGKPTLDATAGRARLLRSAAWGRVVTSTPGQVTLALAALDGRPVEVFDFAGTGVSAEQDTDPAQYEVATGALDVAGLAAGTPARVIGYVTHFGAAPPDFSAKTLGDFAGLDATLEIAWDETGTIAPFVSLEASGLVVDLANVDLKRERLRIGPERIDLDQLSASPALVGASGEDVVFGIAGPERRVRHFSTFAEFITALAAELNGATTLKRLTASGSFDATANRFTARRVLVTLHD